MMTDDNRKRSSKPYDVGYGKPPAEHRWKPDEPSPNRAGRPKKIKPTSKSIAEMAAAEAFRLIKANKGGKKVTITVAEAIFTKLGIDAASGDKRAVSLFFKYLPLNMLTADRIYTVEDMKKAGTIEEVARIYEQLMRNPNC